MKKLFVIGGLLLIANIASAQDDPKKGKNPQVKKTETTTNGNNNDPQQRSINEKGLSNRSAVKKNEIKVEDANKKDIKANEEAKKALKNP